MLAPSARVPQPSHVQQPLDAASSVIYMQNHGGWADRPGIGVLRSDDHGHSWRSIAKGLPSERLFLAAPIGIVAALAFAFVVTPDGLAVAVLDQAPDGRDQADVLDAAEQLADAGRVAGRGGHEAEHAAGVLDELGRWLARIGVRERVAPRPILGPQRGQDGVREQAAVAGLPAPHVDARDGEGVGGDGGAQAHPGSFARSRAPRPGHAPARQSRIRMKMRMMYQNISAIDENSASAAATCCCGS